MRPLLVLCAVLGAASVAAQTAPPFLYSVDAPEGQFGHIFGARIAPVPDADGDGGPDLLIGQPSSVQAHTGYAYLIAGATGAVLRTFAAPLGLESAGFGAGVAPAGDVDGDGVDDVAIGAPQLYLSEYSSRPGYVHLFSVATGGLLQSWSAPEASPRPEAGDAFGETVTLVGDLDGDGVRELAVGAPQRFCGQRRPRVDIFDVRTGARRLVLVPPDDQCDNEFGDAVALLTDLDDDGVREIAVSAPSQFVTRQDAGRVHVFNGATGVLIYSLEAPVPNKFGRFGTALALTGDADGDGHRDLLVGAPGDDPFDDANDYRGQVYLVSAASGSRLRTLASPLADPSGRFGQSLSADRDLDGDGVEDILAGLRTPNNRSAVYALSGATDGVLWSLVSPDADDATSGFGRDGVVSRDLNEDGRQEVVVPSRFEDGSTGYGVVYVFGEEAIVAQPPAPAGVAIRLDVASPATTRAALTIALPAAGEARLTVHDALGREVARPLARPLAAGRHALSLDVAGWAPGVYVVRLVVGAQAVARPLVVVR